MWLAEVSARSRLQRVVIDEADAIMIGLEGIRVKLRTLLDELITWL